MITFGFVVVTADGEVGFVEGDDVRRLTVLDGDVTFLLASTKFDWKVVASVVVASVVVALVVVDSVVVVIRAFDVGTTTILNYPDLPY